MISLLLWRIYHLKTVASISKRLSHVRCGANCENYQIIKENKQIAELSSHVWAKPKRDQGRFLDSFHSKVIAESFARSGYP